MLGKRDRSLREHCPDERRHLARKVHVAREHHLDLGIPQLVRLREVLKLVEGIGGKGHCGETGHAQMGATAGEVCDRLEPRSDAINGSDVDEQLLDVGPLVASARGGTSSDASHLT